MQIKSLNSSENTKDGALASTTSESLDFNGVIVRDSLKELFKTKQHVINLINMVFIWSVSSFNWYLVNF